MQQLQELANERAQTEASVAGTLSMELKAAESNYRGHVSRITTDFGLRRRQLENDFAQAKQQANDTCNEKTAKLQRGYDEKRAQIESNYKKSALAIERNKKESEWQALAVFDAAKDGPQQMLDQASKRLLAKRQQINGLGRDANTLMSMRRLLAAAEKAEPTLDVEPELDEDESADSIIAASGIAEPINAEPASAEQRQQTNLNRLHQAVLTLQGQRLPSVLLEGIRPWGWWLATCALAAAASGPFAGWSAWQTPLLGLVVGSVLSVVFYFLVGDKAKQQSISQFAKIVGLLQQADELEETAQEEARDKSRREAEKINQAKHDALAAAQAKRDEAASKNEARRQAESEHIQRLLDEGNTLALQTRDEALAAAEEKFPPLLDELAKERRTEEQRVADESERRQQQIQTQHDTAWQTMADTWREGFQAVSTELAAMRTTCQQLFPDWSTTEWSDWQRPADPPHAIQFGTCMLPLSVVKNGNSEDPRLQPSETQFELPALMPFDELPRLVVTAEGAGRKAAVDVLQAMMLRFLTAIPAGKLRFTVIDPSALGENFAAFMHLADCDEQLIGTRIWTDSRQIEERLTLLSDHMEKVLQKFLRNEFATLREYNEQAGEVAEPYHVLVVANFPSGLSDASMRKLQTIATAGPRCGVYTLMSVDTEVKLPANFDLSPLLKDAVHLQWVKDRLQWNYPLYEKLPLQLDHVPPRDRLNDLLHAAGEASQQASRVEVPFRVVAPPADELWTGSTARELVVPVGRSGAKDLQALRLGRGTSQHVVISGKTGSGKSTLLHALITNLALHYSPDEVEFYLVDFKKGVEFKAYATGELPHARVIAIESEREFGVSVLERLDVELRQRGERFRELGVQDLAGARKACDDKLPRILLVIDEFQELFVTDDKLSQDAALLLDRLVRQGRAFGIHVLLGSQTLAGAYSLARSTIGQMAVRIALECSEADAHLILSDDNPAARLLSRPGEAIYNDQNGLTDGNSPFQVVWLPDEERQEYLATIRSQLPQDEAAHEPAIVFEGNVPADPRDNQALVQLIEQNDQAAASEPQVWLGSAVRIEPPTSIILRRQSGNNLLVVGQEESLAIGLMTTAVVALAAQRSGTGPAVTVLDGTRPESSEQAAWHELAAALPGKVKVHKPNEVTDVIASLAVEVARRGEASTESTNGTESAHAAHFLVVHDLAQFRNLRQTEEEFSFSSKSADKPIAADKQFRTLLAEGPAVGVHILIWCDSYNGLTRFVDRLTLRELDFRVALQMSAADSTSLIDSPAAGRIGEQRAVFYRDDLGTQVKFRPYGRPNADWLGWVTEQLAIEKVAGPNG